jgi:IS5 family transposase
MIEKLTELFCDVDDFCQSFMPQWQRQLIESGEKKRRRCSQMSSSEIITIIILFHLSGFRNFKQFYRGYVCCHLNQAFPHAVSYTRFVELKRTMLVPLCAYLNQYRLGTVTGISFIDSAKIVVCHNLRIPQHQVFHGMAQRTRGSTGWYYGFKLHLVVNDQGELLSVKVTPANTDDRTPVPELTQHLWGKLFGDKGYINQKLQQELYERGVELITRLRKNMKAQLLNMKDKLLLRKRVIIESIIDQLKNNSQIEHTRHRSPWNFMVNMISGLIAYTFQDKKPSLKMSAKEQKALMAH